MAMVWVKLDDDDAFPPTRIKVEADAIVDDLIRSYIEQEKMGIGATNFNATYNGVVLSRDSRVSEIVTSLKDPIILCRIGKGEGVNEEFMDAGECSDTDQHDFANMEEPKPKRLKTDEVKTVLFLIHHHSWKATVMLPTRHAFPLQEVEKALKKENLPVAIFPKGKFEVVRKNLDFQIAIFKHHRNGVVGCRKTDSEQHDILPPSIECHKNITEFIRQPNNLRIGFQFLWGIEQPYTVDEGKVLLEVQFSPTCGPELEAQRTSILTGFLRSHYGKKYKITASSSGRNSIRYCQFSGGGDIEISKDPTKSISAVLLVGGGQQEEQQTEHCTELHTPPKAGEVGSGVIESEGVSMQTENDVTKQLVANMVLRAATTLHRFAESQPIQKVEDLRYLVTYGCQMGPVHSLKLLKLHIDFEEERLVFFELFHLPPCVASGAYIDMVLNYIFEALDMT